jgi:hypothetical protein
MGLLATNGVLDYLELFPDEKPMLDCVKRFADWLLSIRSVKAEGVKTWHYQNDTDGQPRHYDPYGAKWVELPSPGRWHQDNLGRLLTYCTIRLGDPSYADAWAESFEPDLKGDTGPQAKRDKFGDHGYSATQQFLPWVQARLWNARLTERGVEIQPLHIGPRTPREASLMTPGGRVTVRWNGDGSVDAPAGVTVKDAAQRREPAVQTAGR